jgi:CHAT domain-containing protein
VNELLKALPRDSVFVDFVAYTAWIPPKERTGKEQWASHLLAFLIRSDGEVRRLELGGLQPVEQLIQAWRQAALQNNTVALTAAADELRRRLWQPLQEQLGRPGLVLISPDGPLARFPFAALPGSKPGSYLLEDLAIAYVTSGRQIVDLLQPAAELPGRPGGLLALGGIDFGHSASGQDAFPALAGTRLEVAAVGDSYRRSRPGQPLTLLEGKEARRDKVLAELGRRYAYLHLATHGFFESPARIAALRAGLRDSEIGLSSRESSQRDEVLSFLPLLRSGLVLAGANLAEGGEALLTAQEVEQLDLRGCDLAVLSACETSLGELTQGDGVLGLQRAFHASGVRTLLASLWQVDDAATSVLMEEFYHGLWRTEKPLTRLEALRQAQLLVLRHPERVQQRRQELVKRGISEDQLRGPKGKEIVKLPQGGKVEAGPPTSPPLWWAPFLLSGDVGPVRR